MEKKSGLYLFLVWFKFETAYTLVLTLHFNQRGWCLYASLRNNSRLVRWEACKTGIKQIFSFMSGKQVVTSSNSIKIHSGKLEGSTKFPAKHDT